MNDQFKLSVLKGLQDLKEQGPSSFSSGICYNLKKCMMFKNIEETQNLLIELFPRWEGFSGDDLHPVSHPEYSADFAYDVEFDLWTGEYGARRMALLDFLIETLEGELA